MSRIHEEPTPAQVESAEAWETERSKLAAIHEQAVKAWEQAQRLCDMLDDLDGCDRAFAAMMSAGVVAGAYGCKVRDHDKMRP